MLTLATWLLSGRFTAAAPGATEFLGDAISTIERGRVVGKEPSVLALFFGILWKLALVVVLIWLTIWILRRTLKIGGLPLATHSAIRVVAVTHLDARRAIYLVEIGDHLLAVGGGGESLSLLADITSPEEKAAIRERLQEPSGQWFGSYLSAWAARMAGGGTKGQLQEGRGFLAERLAALRRQREKSHRGGTA